MTMLLDEREPAESARRKCSAKWHANAAPGEQGSSEDDALSKQYQSN